MKFLEAHRVVEEFEGGPERRCFIGMSGTADPLFLYLRAAGAQRGIEVVPEAAPFGTLRQSVLSGGNLAPAGADERWILTPWDLVPELDWRTGFPDVAGVSDLEAEAQRFLQAVGQERLSKSFYLAAPIPPIHPHPDETAFLARSLLQELSASGATIWSPERFSLSSYLHSGFPLASGELGAAARELVASLIDGSAEPMKVLVTDLDGVLWDGIIGDDGPEGVECSPEGRGYRHFLYQSFLLKLKREGGILAAVSRNDPAVVEEAFERVPLSVEKEDFVSVLATYGAKSTCLRELAEGLNLGLDSFVFVDDNPVELAEVQEALPSVNTVRFPDSLDAFGGFLDRLAGLFAKHRLTPEDRKRTDYYRQRLEGMVPSGAEGADLTAFLQDLQMVLTIRDRTHGNRDRVVQLINKTNQFNLNGIRRSDEEVRGMLEEGGKLFGASLRDRTGEHGEILACLLDGEGRVRSLVMSCRVFQRRVEHAFLQWLLKEQGGSKELEFRVTERNEPLRHFLRSLGADQPEHEGWVGLEGMGEDADSPEVDGLFKLETPA